MDPTAEQLGSTAGQLGPEFETNERRLALTSLLITYLSLTDRISIERSDDCADTDPGWDDSGRIADR
jgi:hypothetical protein